MTTRSLILRGPQVRAALDGRLSAVIVPLREQPVSQGVMSFGEAWAWGDIEDGGFKGCTADQIRRFGAQSGMAPFAAGDVLVCKETWARIHGPQRAVYKADLDNPEEWLWSSPVTMPRWASRLTLIVGDVQVLRVQDVTEEQAIALGWPCEPGDLWPTRWWLDEWATRYPKPPHDWPSNPWCALAGVTVKHGNVDAMEAAE